MRSGGLSVTRRSEALADHLEADDQIRIDDVPFPLPDAGGQTPGQELRIALDVGHKVEQLLRRVGQYPLLGVGRHSQSWEAAAAASFASRASRIRRKSSPA